MNQPWGLSGPQFTGLYIALFVAAIVLVFVMQLVLTRADRRSADTGIPLDTYQIAYLSGGPSRVLETAIAGLALRDQILVARRGKLTAVHGASPNGPVEAAVYHELTMTDTAPQGRILHRLRHHAAVEAIRDQVRSLGLLLSPSRLLLWRLVMLLPVAVWCVGLVRAINGAHLGRPIGNLTTLLIITAFATAIVVLGRWFSASNQPSAAGRTVLRRLRRERLDRKAARAGDVDVQVAGVAVLGFTALADPALRSALFTSTGSGGGGGDGGGGGGCGGGGGGCGG
jgi:uncharacterized protein (TIGR04222 family)